MPDVSFGIVQLSLEPGDHVCGFYNALDMRDDMMVPFVRGGLESGHKCVCFINETRNVVSKLGEGGDARPAAPSQLEFRDADDAYLADGSFSKDVMIGRLEHDVTAALDEGYPIARVVGDMSWVIRNRVDPRLVFAYEAEVNEYSPRYPQLLLCLYDLNHFNGSLVVDVLKTHPKILLNGMIVQNPYYVPPSEFMAGRGAHDN